MTNLLLSQKDEITLARRINLGLYVEHLIATHNLPAHVDGFTARRLVQEGRDAMDTFVDANRGLVAWECRRWSKGGGYDNELFQEGCVGLIEAVQRWDENTGSRFASYAIHWIRMRVREHAMTGGGQCGVDARVLRRARDGQMDAVRGACVLALSAPVSLYRETGEPLPLAAPEPDEPEDDVVVAALSALSPVERAVMCARIGWSGDQALSQRQLADQWGLTRYQIAEVEERAIRRMRQRLVQQMAA